jgi:hypothetical protein
MFVWKDDSYIIDSYFAIEQGFAEEDISCLSLRANNSGIIKEYSNGATVIRGYERNVSREEMESRVKNVCDTLAKHFKLYQYIDSYLIPYDSNWDLFFWCNHKADDGGRDYSYVRLGFNKLKTLEERQQLCTEVIEKIKSTGIDIDIAIRLCVLWNEELVEKTVTAFCEDCIKPQKHPFITYKGQEGKIKKLKEGEYAFLPKYARTKGYYIHPQDKAILRMALV